MMSDDVLWNYTVISLWNKATFTKCFHLFLYQNITYVFHLWPSKLVFVHLTSASSHHNTTHHQHTNATLEQDDSKTCLPVYCVLTSGLSTVCRSHRRLTRRRLTSFKTKRACSEHNRYEIEWHVVSLTREGLTPKLYEQTGC